ncbi:pur operon repressor [Pediococcus claussenii]|uniref:Pur operon repressor PurR n=1 Tax=Pediococcus claussenii (strain ATCC BAA-344 / DSM 14800 / JCM 18046 / KCTC 3811 / LMG 21948 / P06) TaxID=701521 RepID=G8PEV7_PEDCP|nr:pur operon repressor [Pediococcus claussenii]AEV94487.1 pur operon repressor PurR [Pediococcus claussenii ATCC BAA-344]ANZ69704.1 pur operon repressor [Pediococcus claussenii]ANZ71521.1 pur operon repressor [Pediococcus claussenii]KRN19807.1 purR protein [Pediococcus claussenii]
MKFKRSERLIDMTNYLMTHPRTLISAGFFIKRYDSAKSSISEDLGIMKATLETQKIGSIEITNGPTGGVRFIPSIGAEEAKTVTEALIKELSEPTRRLPGGYVYMSDILGDPQMIRNIGRILASEYVHSAVDVVMTVETKGIPLAQAVAEQLNVPFIIVRHDAKITEGSTISVNYVSKSSEQIKKMELSKRSLPVQSKVLVVDDFLKGGGTIAAMTNLIQEFDAELIGVSVFAEGSYNGTRSISEYTSVLKVDTSADDTIKITSGNYQKRIFKGEK